MQSRVWVAVLLALPVVACGGSTFGGLGDEEEDTGVLSVDDASLGDVIFPPDDTTPTDSGLASDSTVAPDTLVTDSRTDATDGDALGETLDAADIGDTRDATPDADARDATDAADVTDAIDAGDSADAGDATDAADAADATSPVHSDPGETKCYDTEHTPAIAVLCPSSAFCCGDYQLFTLSWHWSCATSCFAGRDYHCDEKADCTGGKVCCAAKSVVGTINGSDCRDTCGGDLQLCATNAECGTKTCEAYTPPDANHSVGACK